MGAKSKGSEFERKICKDLTVWNGGDPRKPHFWRQPASGAFNTKYNDENMSGDIRSISPLSSYFTDKISLEAKTGYKEASLDKTLKYNTSDPLLAHWIQCSNDARKVDKYPLLVFQKKGVTPIWVGIAKEMEKSLRKQLVGCRYVHICWAEPTEDVWLFSYTDFFSVITPQVFKDFVI